MTWMFDKTEPISFVSFTFTPSRNPYEITLFAIVGGMPFAVTNPSSPGLIPATWNGNKMTMPRRESRFFSKYDILFDPVCAEGFRVIWGMSYSGVEVFEASAEVQSGHVRCNSAPPIAQAIITSCDGEYPCTNTFDGDIHTKILVSSNYGKYMTWMFDKTEPISYVSFTFTPGSNPYEITLFAIVGGMPFAVTNPSSPGLIPATWNDNKMTMPRREDVSWFSKYDILFDTVCAEGFLVIWGKSYSGVTVFEASAEDHSGQVLCNRAPRIAQAIITSCTFDGEFYCTNTFDGDIHTKILVSKNYGKYMTWMFDKTEPISHVSFTFTPGSNPYEMTLFAIVGGMSFAVTNLSSPGLIPATWNDNKMTMPRQESSWFSKYDILFDPVCAEGFRVIWGMSYSGVTVLEASAEDQSGQVVCDTALPQVRIVNEVVKCVGYSRSGYPCTNTFDNNPNSKFQVDKANGRYMTWMFKFAAPLSRMKMVFRPGANPYVIKIYSIVNGNPQAVTNPSSPALPATWNNNEMTMPRNMNSWFALYEIAFDEVSEAQGFKIEWGVSSSNFMEVYDVEFSSDSNVKSME